MAQPAYDRSDDSGSRPVPLTPEVPGAEPSVDAFGATDVGRRRERNEDHYLVGQLAKAMLIQDSSGVFGDDGALFGRDRGRLYLVADGVGGNVAGHEASASAVESVAQYVLAFMPWWCGVDPHGEDDLRAEMESAVRACEIGLRELEQTRPEIRGLGTTLTMAFVTWPVCYLVHVGDSRAYIYRGRRLERLTRDHTVAQQLADEGVIEQGEVDRSPLASVLWNAVGGDDTLALPDIYRVELAVGDTLLLCSDGLTKHLADAEIGGVLGRERPAATSCRDLIAAANESGGSDNITVIVARFGG